MTISRKTVAKLKLNISHIVLDLDAALLSEVVKNFWTMRKRMEDLRGAGLCEGAGSYRRVRSSPIRRPVILLPTGIPNVLDVDVVQNSN
jgi:hypothetical protein